MSIQDSFQLRPRVLLRYLHWLLVSLAFGLFLILLGFYPGPSQGACIAFGVILFLCSYLLLRKMRPAPITVDKVGGFRGKRTSAKSPEDYDWTWEEVSRVERGQVARWKPIGKLIWQLLLYSFFFYTLGEEDERLVIELNDGRRIVIWDYQYKNFEELVQAVAGKESN